ncbi:MFS transporter [Agromyces sp. NPDC049794]|uniref:MFS transporter n=1 Tax=unclassified Agromyces TaxID=2639701 RepID=UPI0033FC474F
MTEQRVQQGARTERVPRRGVSLAVLIVNQLLAGVGVASGITVAALLVADLTDVEALGGLAQSASVLGAAIVAVPLARLAVWAGRHVALATGYACALAGAVLIVVAATTGWVPLVFLGLAAFGAGAASGLQARFAATEVAAPGFEARAMSLVLWATTLGSVTGPLLADLGEGVGALLGLPQLVGSFLFSGTAFALSTVLVGTLLRMPPAGHLATDEPVEAIEPENAVSVDGAVAQAAPDAPPADGAAPAAGTAPRPAAAPAARVGAWQALRTAVRNPTALLAILAIVCSHTVMVGVMVMTPIHMTQHGGSLTFVGIVISIHILGMYGASPIMGWLVDRIGSTRVIGIGVVILLTATTIGILAPGDDVLLLPLALGLLGLGWSAGLIGGSTLLTTTVDERLRVPLQGATDAAMNVAAAASAALSGLVLGIGGFPGVNVVAIIVLVPLVVAGLRLTMAGRRAPA